MRNLVFTRQDGITLVETIVFLVVVSIALAAVVRSFTQSVQVSVDPLVRIRALDLAQAQLDEILARKFDENTPTGGIPACGTSGAPACLGISPDGDFDDVGDYNGNPTISSTEHTLSVTVTEAGTEIGLSANALARKITVNVTVSGSDSITLTAYKTNF